MKETSSPSCRQIRSRVVQSRFRFLTDSAAPVASAQTRPDPDQRAFPLALSRVQAGFPSPAEDFMDQPLNLNSYLIDNPAATFFVRAGGDSMIGAGIHQGDLLIVDRSQHAVSGDVVIAIVDGEFTVKRLFIHGSYVELRPENRRYPTLKFSEETELEIWGVVKSVIHQLN